MRATRGRRVQSPCEGSRRSPTSTQGESRADGTLAAVREAHLTVTKRGCHPRFKRVNGLISEAEHILQSEAESAYEHEII